ncbi:MAG TPA: hypothetical protein VIQ24_16440 [Pyrinomonadaceae bacterium]
MGKRISVVRETRSGRNVGFKDNRTGRVMSRPELVKKIEGGQYAHYHVRKIAGVKTPVSNPDRSKGNNLG